MSSRALFQFQAEVLLQLLFEMSAGSISTLPLTDSIYDDFAVQSHPFTTNFLLQFGDICYFVAINPFLENAPNTVVKGVEVRQIWWPDRQSEESINAGVSFFNSSILSSLLGVLVCCPAGKQRNRHQKCA